MEVFDAKFCAELRTQLYNRPDWAPPGLAHIALSEESAPVRQWMGEALDHLPDPGRSKLANRLRHEDHFITAFSELSVAAAIITAGLAPEYEPLLHGKTPDLYVSDTATGQPVVIDVWTRQVPKGTRTTWVAWDELRTRITRIPVGVGMTVAALNGSTPAAPTSGDSKRIAAALKDWLLRAVRMPGDSYAVYGLRFRVFRLLPEMHARLASPALGGSVDSGVVTDAIRDKVRRYKPIAELLDAHLLVVAASEPAAPLSLDLFRGALEGRQSFAFSFNPGSSGVIGESATQMRSSDQPHDFDPVLSAVAYIECGDATPALTTIHLEGAQRPMRTILT